MAIDDTDIWDYLEIVFGMPPFDCLNPGRGFELNVSIYASR
jgi:hypothetical protein